MCIKSHQQCFYCLTESFYGLLFSHHLGILIMLFLEGGEHVPQLKASPGKTQRIQPNNNKNNDCRSCQYSLQRKTEGTVPLWPQCKNMEKKLLNSLLKHEMYLQRRNSLSLVKTTENIVAGLQQEGFCSDTSRSKAVAQAVQGMVQSSAPAIFHSRLNEELSGTMMSRRGSVEREGPDAGL